MSTCLIMFQTCKFYYKKYSIISYLYMSNWKFLAEQSRDSQSNYSGNKQKKYTPRRQANDQQSPSRFLNQTIDRDRMSQSGISQEKDKIMGRSFVGRPSQIAQPKVLKSSSSEIKLHRDILHDRAKRSTLLSSGSFFINVQDQIYNKMKDHKNRMDMKGQKAQLLEQIQRLRKQFSLFQGIIFKELRRQEKIMNSMIEEIINQIKSPIGSPSNTFTFHAIPSELPPQRQVEDKLGLKRASLERKMLHDQVKQKINDVFVSSKPSLNIQISEKGQNGTQKRNDSSFNRFFQAVKNLKRDIKDLSQISDMTSIASPKSSINKTNWPNWQNYTKMPR